MKFYIVLFLLTLIFCFVQPKEGRPLDNEPDSPKSRNEILDETFEKVKEIGDLIQKDYFDSGLINPNNFIAGTKLSGLVYCLKFMVRNFLSSFSFNQANPDQKKNRKLRKKNKKN